MRRRCLVCGDPRLHGRGRCNTCYHYRRRNGRDRPFHLIATLTSRDIERELTRIFAL